MEKNLPDKVINRLTLYHSILTDYIEKNIEYIFFGTIEENSNAIGKYNKAIIAIKDKNFAEAILKIINGGDTKWKK